MKEFTAAFDVWSSGGGVLLALAGVSMMIFALFCRSIGSIRSLLKSAEDLGDALEVCGGDAEKISTCLRTGNSWLAGAYVRCLNETADATCMARLERIETGCVQAQSRDLLLLSAFTAAAPLLGLLGTVIGMIATFNATASLDGDTGQQIAKGISSALITTQFGLVIALPGVFGIAHIQKRVRELETLLCQCRFLIVGGAPSARR